MAHWTIIQETHEQQITVRRDGEIQFPYVHVLERTNGNIPVRTIASATFDAIVHKMEDGDTITVSLTIGTKVEHSSTLDDTYRSTKEVVNDLVGSE